MKKVSEIVARINEFYKENENLGEIIKDELRNRSVTSLPCYSMGGCEGWCEDVIDSLVFLRVGFMNENAFKHHGNKDSEVLCVLGFDLGSKVDVFMNGYEAENPLRIMEEFDRLPMSMQIEIFRSCFGGFEYAHNYRSWFKELTKNNEDFNRLKPTFDKCYVADYDNACRELAFSGTWDESGRAIFETLDEDKKKAYFPEKALFKIAKGDVEYWGFDYAFSFDKERLRKICKGGFTKDYTKKK
jgi:hypothetical protein